MEKYYDMSLKKLEEVAFALQIPYDPPLTEDQREFVINDIRWLTDNHMKLDSKKIKQNREAERKRKGKSCQNIVTTSAREVSLLSDEQLIFFPTLNNEGNKIYYCFDRSTDLFFALNEKFNPFTKKPLTPAELEFLEENKTSKYPDIYYDDLFTEIDRHILHKFDESDDESDYDDDDEKVPKMSEDIQDDGPVYNLKSVEYVVGLKDPTPKRDETIDKMYEMGLLETLTQPFPVGYGFKPDGDLDIDELRDFVESDNYYKTMGYLVYVTGKTSLIYSFLEALGITPGDCIILGRFLYGNNTNLVRLSDMDPDSRGYIYEIDRLKNRYINSNRRGDYQMLSAITDGPYTLDLEFSDTIGYIDDCIYDGKLVRLVMVVEGQHITQLLYNPLQKMGWFFETSYHDPKIVEYNREALEIMFKYYFDSEAKIVIPDFDLCYSGIQEPYDTCAGWTTYILILSLLNPELTEYDILEYFYKLKRQDPYYLNLIIILFYKYIYEALRPNFNRFGNINKFQNFKRPTI